MVGQNWKEEQRALSARARQVRIHSPEHRKQVGGLLVFPSGTTYEVQPNGSLKRVHVHQEPEAQLND